ncbi:NB-ARC domain-containing protein [Saccharothrix sp. NPDC042600]|uniref:NB-ARC domain-containing protein n=1 Tax=Saccharothrix TaxID=2071 RepID=UPI0033F39837|nr:hypothetical protein GCM10017745_81390 [Saccharothrix mutabilis subsp. capreolus]
MSDRARVHNEATAEVPGVVVQAGDVDKLVLAGWNDAGADRVEPRVVPRQLPMAIRDFTGRTDYLAALDALLSAADEGGAEAVVISAVDGAAGIGKTTLAVWWAHRVQDRFPDGTLYANLRGYGPGDPATATEVLDGFLRALGARAERIPADVEARAGLFRSMLVGRRILIVLDNANSADQVRPLLPGSSGCVVVVTSRDSLTGLVVGLGAVLRPITPGPAHRGGSSHRPAHHRGRGGRGTRGRGLPPGRPESQR